MLSLSFCLAAIEENAASSPPPFIPYIKRKFLLLCSALQSPINPLWMRQKTLFYYFQMVSKGTPDQSSRLLFHLSCEAIKHKRRYFNLFYLWTTPELSGRVLLLLSKLWMDTPVVHTVSVTVLQGERTLASLRKCLFFFKLANSIGGMSRWCWSLFWCPKLVNTQEKDILSIKKMCFIMTFSERKWQNNSRCSL